MQRQILIDSASVEKLKQKARKLKKDSGMPHHQALDATAMDAGFAHWHHVSESAKALAPTETAYHFGIIIAMDVKDAMDFHDETGSFVEDPHAFALCADDLYRNLVDAVDEEDGVQFREKYSESELKEWATDDLMNYCFFRYTGNPIPEQIDDVMAHIRKCSFWPPVFIWFKGSFQESPSDNALNTDGEIVGIRF